MISSIVSVFSLETSKEVGIYISIFLETFFQNVKIIQVKTYVYIHIAYTTHVR